MKLKTYYLLLITIILVLCSVNVLGAGEQLFSDNAEVGAVGAKWVYTTNMGFSYSSTQKYSGTYSIRNENVASGNARNLTKWAVNLDSGVKILTFKFYDTSTGYYTESGEGMGFGFANTTATGFGWVGGECAFSINMFNQNPNSYSTCTGLSGTECQAVKARSNGWHNVTLLYNHTGNYCKLTVDGTVGANHAFIAHTTTRNSMRYVKYAGSTVSDGYVYFDEVILYNQSITPPPSAPIRFTALANKAWDSTTINTFNVTVVGVGYNKTFGTTTGTVNTDLYSNATQKYNLTYFSTGNYFPSKYYNINVSSPHTGTMQQSIINITIKNLLTNQTESGVVIKFNGTIKANTTNFSNIFYPNSGWYNIQVSQRSSANDFHTTSNNIKINATNNKTIIVYVHDHDFNITAKNIRTNVAINTFNVTLYSLNRSDTRFTSTTNGLASFPVIHDCYNITINANGYALYNNSIIKCITGNYKHNFSLYTTNSILIRFYDASTKLLLNNETVTTQFIGSTKTNKSTSNGTLYIDLLNPSEYTLVYDSANYRQGQYILTLSQSSFNNLNLYMEKENITSLILIKVKDTYNTYLQNADITIQRYSGNAWIVDQIRRTDFQGQTEAYFILSTVFYNFIVDYQGVTYFGTINSDNEKKQIYAEDVTNGITIVIDTITDNTIETYQSLYGITTSLTYTELTNISGYFRCSFDDSTNEQHNATLKTYRNGVLFNTINTYTSTGQIIQQNIASANTTMWASECFIDGQLIDNINKRIGTSDNRLNFNWGSIGYFIALIIFLLVVFGYADNPSISIIGGTIAFSCLIVFGIIFKNYSLSLISLIIFIGGIVAFIKSNSGVNS